MTANQTRFSHSRTPVILILSLAAVAVYWNSLSAPFIFDDENAIQNNSSIRRLADVFRIISPQENIGRHTGGRPLLNLSFALNYAVFESRVAGYHLTNLALHITNGLLLFAVIRRTFARAMFTVELRNRATPSAGTIALLWLVHPLQTESVTFISQRAELLATCCYLSALYAFIRATTQVPASSRWFALSVGACLIGVGCKETIVTAPLLIFLYDRTFTAGSFMAAWRLRRWYYGALLSTWMALGLLMAYSGGPRGGAGGFGGGVSSWAYALTQSEALVHYIRLGIWPYPLIFDYGQDVATSLGAVWPEAAAVILFIAITIYALVRRPVLGFLGAAFFIVISPSSSFVPLLTQTWAEHRMYLPLAAELTLIVAVVQAGVSRTACMVLATAAAVGFGLLTVSRNFDYRSEHALWLDTVAKRPGNARAHLGLGSALLEKGSTPQAILEFRTALRLDPNSAPGHAILGRSLLSTGRSEEALVHLQRAVALKPGNAEMRRHLGDGLKRIGKLAAALAEYQNAVELAPRSSIAHAALATGYQQSGRIADSIVHNRIALSIDPDLTEAHINLATAMAESGQFNEAVVHYEAALRRVPNDADVHFLLAVAYARSGILPKAIGHCETALKLQPSHVDAREELARLQSIKQSGKVITPR